MLLNKKNILLIIFSIAILSVFTGIVCADESGDSSFFSLDDIFHHKDKKEIKTTKVKIYNFKDGELWKNKAKRLDNGNAIAGYVEYEDNKQYDKGTGVVAWYAGSDGEDIDSHHTKIVKTKFFFKNKSTGEKLKKKVNGTKTDLIDGFTPYKAKVWYEVV